jgi:hypothetical protein
MPPRTSTLTLTFSQRPLWQRVLRFPFVGYRHYVILRQTNGRIVSAYGAWLLAGVVVRPGKRMETA